MATTGKSRSRRPTATGGATPSASTILIFFALSGLVIWLLASNPFAQKLSPNRTAVKESSTATDSDPTAVTKIDTEKSPENEEIRENADQGTAADDEPEKSRGAESESGEENEKQPELERQTSEESSITQNQAISETESENQNAGAHPEIEEDSKNNSGNDDAQKQGLEEAQQKLEEEDRKVGSLEAELLKAEDKENHLSDEDEEKRISEQQKKEDDQIQVGNDDNQPLDPPGSTSSDQIQHDDQQIQQIHEHQSDNPEIKQTANKEENTGEEKSSSPKNDEPSSSSFPNGETSGIPIESKESKKSWSTQAGQSENENERRKTIPTDKDNSNYGYSWKLCNETAGADYIPCLDNEKYISKLRSRMHYEHRERHCPKDPPTCLVPLPPGYKKSVQWPKSRDKIWYKNVPHTLLAEVKGHQNWVKVTGEFITFPGGGTQFIHGALHYIDFIQEAVPEIAWGKHTRVVLDVGCGVASFGGYLFDRDVLTMSFAPKDEHEAQVQFALERGIPAISAVMGTQRLPFPSRVFELVHCARCRVPWHADGGKLLLELNRVLRPGGYFVWSATPVYQKLEEDVQIWK
ncbi:hypothetical protein M569_13900, partial [Genlisea aurea]